MDPHLVAMCSAAALAGLCASNAHPPGQHPTGDAGSADAVAARALVLGKALAAKLEAERDAAPAIDDAVADAAERLRKDEERARQPKRRS